MCIMNIAHVHLHRSLLYILTKGCMIKKATYNIPAKNKQECGRIRDPVVYSTRDEMIIVLL